MRVLLVEPYYGGSHKAWADGYRRFSRHTVDLLTLPAQFWKWRMQGGAVTLARLYADFPQPDVILATDMMDLSLFRALARPNTPLSLYFHENQLTYPQNDRQRHGWQYGFINYASALAADRIYFNSAFHREAFFDELPRMLKHFGDYNELDTVAELQGRSEVLWLGLDLRRYDVHQTERSSGPPLIVWNHRWEADKNPTEFLRALHKLADAGIEFRVALVGENFSREPTEFEAARDRLGARVVHYGFIEAFATYARLLWQADFVVSSAYQDFFGGAIAEAIYCGCVPLLPRRLNYPALVPETEHRVCTYHGDGGLHPLLRRHLTESISINVDALRAHVAQFDWSKMAPRYDKVLTLLAQGQ